MPEAGNLSALRGVAYGCFFSFSCSSIVRELYVLRKYRKKSCDGCLLHRAKARVPIHVILPVIIFHRTGFRFVRNTEYGEIGFPDSRQ